MPDPEAQPPEPPAPEEPPGAVPDPALEPPPPIAQLPPRPYLPFMAYPGPAAAPPALTWTKAYEHPTARRVVSTGLQLAVEANRDIRRASIYIGLLALGAFGPAMMLLLLGIARLLGDPSIAATLAENPALVFIDQPDLAGPISLIYFLLIVGGVLLIAISVDAQAMAISILGGRASEQPLRLWEAIVRARQVFWRLLAADIMVGAVSLVMTIVITILFFRPFDSNTGVSFIGSMIGTLVVTPFVFTSAGIVLGDVGPAEALRRSIALFRARPRISIVVTLFTLVTSAIQQFAVNAGMDAALRVGEILHLGLDQGPLPLILTIVIVLAFIVAFGSLTFTIAAIVAAPQVTGFLGLTYYSGGLDRARSKDGVRPRRFRWVSVPMALVIGGIVVIAGLELPTITGFQARPSGAILSFLRTAADEQGEFVSAFGRADFAEDPSGDGGAPGSPTSDIVAAEHASLSEVPEWLLNGAFACGASGVTCASAGSSDSAFIDGAILFGQRVATPPGASPSTERTWGPMVHIEGGRVGPSPHDDRFREASHAYITTGEGPSSSIRRYERSPSGSFTEGSTSARSIWVGDALITMIPPDELDGYPLTWDMFACETGVTLTTDTCDFLRAKPTDAMRPFEGGLEYVFLGDFVLPTITSDRPRPTSAQPRPTPTRPGPTPARPQGTSAQAPAPGALSALLQPRATANGMTVAASGEPNTVEDRVNDVLGGWRPSLDIVEAGFAYLPEVPDWLLSSMFACGTGNVACGDPKTGADAFQGGAYLFYQRMSGPPGVETDRERGQWGPLIVINGARADPYSANASLSGASHVVLTRLELNKAEIVLFVAASDFGFDTVPTTARSTWIGNDLLTLVPVEPALRGTLVQWDVTASIGSGHDALRPTSMTPLGQAPAVPYEIVFVEP